MYVNTRRAELAGRSINLKSQVCSKLQRGSGKYIHIFADAIEMGFMYLVSIIQTMGQGINHSANLKVYLRCSFIHGNCVTYLLFASVFGKWTTSFMPGHLITL